MKLLVTLNPGTPADVAEAVMTGLRLIDVVADVRAEPPKEAPPEKKSQ